MRTILLICALAAIAAIWWNERLSAARLQVEIEARRTDAREVAGLQRERDRLRALQPSAAELTALHHAGALHAQLQAAVEAQETNRASSAAKLELGDWRPASSWQNCGRATPNAAIETTLWAAAGGDTATLKNLLSIEGATREKAEALLAQLPAAAREQYATAEDLIAAFTVRGTPVGSAQLVWCNQSDDDNATACVFLQKPVPPDADVATASPTEATRPEAARQAAPPLEPTAHVDHKPPQARDNGRGSEAFLSLHRDDDGWRLVVPPSVVDSIIARHLANPPAPARPN